MSILTFSPVSNFGDQSLEKTTIHLSGLPKEGGQDAFSYLIFNSFYPKMIATFAIKSSTI